MNSRDVCNNSTTEQKLAVTWRDVFAYRDILSHNRSPKSYRNWNLDSDFRFFSGAWTARDGHQFPIYMHLTAYREDEGIPAKNAHLVTVHDAHVSGLETHGEWRLSMHFTSLLPQTFDPHSPKNPLRGGQSKQKRRKHTTAAFWRTAIGILGNEKESYDCTMVKITVLETYTVMTDMFTVSPLYSLQ